MLPLQPYQRANITDVLDKATLVACDQLKIGGDPARAAAASEVVKNLTAALATDNEARL